MDLRSEDQVTYIGETNARGKHVRFGIKRKDRRYHMHIIGRTGTGKSTLIEYMIRQDIQNGEGCALFDPHGDLVEKVAANVPEHRRTDLIYWNVPDDRTLSFNPLERRPRDQQALVASGLLDVFRSLWSDSWGPRLEHILRNCLLALLDQPHTCFADIPKLLINDQFRKAALANVRNNQVYEFWMREYVGYGPRLRAEAIAPLQNKVGAFLVNPVLQRILDGSRPSIQMRRIIDSGKVFLVNLSKGRIGADAAALFGGLLVAQLGHAALTRTDTAPEQRRDFYCYLDEFPTYTSDSLAGMLAELRKYRMNLVLANQSLGQLDDTVSSSLLANCGTLITFRLGVEDAEVLRQELLSTFHTEDLVDLPSHQLYLKLMIDGAVSLPFSAAVLVF